MFPQTGQVTVQWNQHDTILCGQGIKVQDLMVVYQQGQVAECLPDQTEELQPGLEEVFLLVLEGGYRLVPEGACRPGQEVDYRPDREVGCQLVQEVVYRLVPVVVCRPAQEVGCRLDQSHI